VNEQTQGARIKRRRTRAEIERLAAEYEVSGLGRTAFCQQKGLSLSTLARYRRRQKQTAGEGAWLAVEVCGSAAVAGDGRASGLAVVLSGGRRIEVGRGFDGDTLKRLLAVVERG
jgi:hypothetical protein